MGWMDDLWFYILFNSVLVISGQYEVDNEGYMQWSCVYSWEGLTTMGKPLLQIRMVVYIYY